jgi:hypothetical protein
MGGGELGTDLRDCVGGREPSNFVANPFLFVQVRQLLPAYTSVHSEIVLQHLGKSARQSLS